MKIKLSKSQWELIGKTAGWNDREEEVAREIRQKQLDSEDVETVNLFHPDYVRKTREMCQKTIFEDQDKAAKQSKVFKRILESEWSGDPDLREKQTNHPKAKTRNALLTKGVYPTIKEWEDYLLSSSFYGLKHQD